MSAPLLSVQNLGLTVASATAPEPRMILSDVGFDISEQEAVALVGESGSGKSMTARSLIGLLPQDSRLTGEITFRGKSVIDMDKRELLSYRRNDVAMIFQDPRAHIDPTQTIGDFLTERLVVTGKRARRTAKARVLELLADVHISHPERRLAQYPHELSGGMLQRVMIAGALASEPALLLADEPTTALDVTVQAEILRVLTELREEHRLAMLFITHDLALAGKTCDRTVVMYAGRVVEVNDTSDIEHTAVHPYTIGLMQSRPSLDTRWERLEALGGRPIAADEVAGQCCFDSRCRLADEACRAGEPAARRWEHSLVACVRPEETRSRLAVTPPAANLADEQAPRSDVLIEVNDLRRQFGHRSLGRSTEPMIALDGVSFQVARGESLAIVGESGSGKTTIARILVGLDQPTSGSVKIGDRRREGRKLAGLSRKESAKLIQIVFQDPYQSLDPSQTVGSSLREVVRFAIGLKGTELDARVNELATQVGIDPALLRRYPRALSGGQRQRVAIARALASEPSVLVLDEATASLDASIQAQILNLLTDLRAKLRLTYIFIAHDLAVVRQVADTAIVLCAGAVVEQGTVEQILNSPSAEYTKRLVDSSPARMAALQVSATGVAS